jgi:hypothetical protein
MYMFLSGESALPEWLRFVYICIFAALALFMYNDYLQTTVHTDYVTTVYIDVSTREIAPPLPQSDYLPHSDGDILLTYGTAAN